jgi:hypothetical protein
VCAPDLGVGDDGSGRAGTMSEDGRAVGGRSWLPKGAGGGAGLEPVVAGGDVGDGEGGVGVGGSVRLGGSQLVDDAARAGAARAASAAPPGYTRPTPPAPSRSARRVGRPLGLLAQVVDERAQLRPATQRPSGVTAGSAGVGNHDGRTARGTLGCTNACMPVTGARRGRPVGDEEVNAGGIAATRGMVGWLSSRVARFLRP